MEKDKKLLRYLSMAVPYRVKILYEGWDSDRGCEYSTVETLIGINDRFIYTLWRDEKDKHSIQEPLSIVDYKPFLRPMSSMTDEEEKEYNILCNYNNNEQNAIILLNWLLEKRFDFMGLIPEGLAIEVTEERNPYKTEE